MESKKEMGKTELGSEAKKLAILSLSGACLYATSRFPPSQRIASSRRSAGQGAGGSVSPLCLVGSWLLSPPLSRISQRLPSFRGPVVQGSGSGLVSPLVMLNTGF